MPRCHLRGACDDAARYGQLVPLATAPWTEAAGQGAVDARRVFAQGRQTGAVRSRACLIQSLWSLRSSRRSRWRSRRKGDEMASTTQVALTVAAVGACRVEPRTPSEA